MTQRKKASEARDCNFCGSRMIGLGAGWGWWRERRATAAIVAMSHGVFLLRNGTREGIENAKRIDVSLPSRRGIASNGP